MLLAETYSLLPVRNAKMQAMLPTRNYFACVANILFLYFLYCVLRDDDIWNICDSCLRITICLLGDHRPAVSVWSFLFIFFFLNVSRMIAQQRARMLLDLFLSQIYFHRTCRGAIIATKASLPERDVRNERRAAICYTNAKYCVQN